MLKLFKPAPPIERLPEDQIDSEYKKFRLQVFLGIFIGYAAYYLIRKNFSLAMPYLIEEGFSKSALGFALSALSISYGLSKFVMATISDRSNPRMFLPAGLILSAVISLLMGFVPFFTSSIAIMFIMLFLNGWFQGMGWPPSGRVLVHWFSVSERGNKTAIWNVAHNVGGGLMAPIAVAGVAIFSGITGSATGYEGVFILPALVAIAVAVISYWLIRDTPQSVGLPPIEEYRNDYSSKSKKTFEKELSTKEILFKHVLNNKWVWAIALANIFVYFVRYGVLDWAPTYLSEEKGFDMSKSSVAYFLYEWAGIPGTLLCGWISDKWFKGRRGPAGFVFMAGVLIAVLVYWFNPAGNPMIDMASLIAIGFLIYGPVMLIGLQALDFVPKKAAGTAAGLTGLFGYLGGTLTANALMGVIVDASGWNAGFTLLTASCAIAALIFAMTWNVRGQEVVKH
ncbi:glycerol-3-phosphate transporter [Bacillus licheniformis]|jgi:OPA family glycerol-3-phosphate transporter-like MFS transporter|uniref:Glycerol-3-phosphate transporter n=2 Tax=Bacillus licheniformis TaxID=1402 RepID=Q65CZ6_BACLD|nr:MULTISPECIES: glycerol-3-phosphate transporter [Bacillus]MBJ7885964.1 glycerol-3-phosphate transporter [Bacillaceae bacterium HSR45]MBY8348575.1 glycerol-3-phosphate transporter [Bacillus sp. PCH94]MDP4081194.1 glycerol-3-phosphate transporter [Bacillota bacterium]AAU25689.1 glycerol-3-phosphate permease [Bacillus licheniformis DSM 13 = ATCC 14580]AAU43068.1 glycerol-3-phosphate permease GlpT [Bacillus licheniformis DSM 13 = ATCC 14580]